MDDHRSRISSLASPMPSHGALSKSTLLCTWSDLPFEILLCTFHHLTVEQLIPCQLVSRHFRTVARVVLMDKLGGQFLRQQQREQQQEALLAQNKQQQKSQRAWADSLPPLPSNHYHNNSSNIAYSSTHGIIAGRETSSSSSSSNGSTDQHHPLHNHLYQNQSMEGLSEHPQTDLHIHRQSHGYNIATHSQVSSASSSSSTLPEQQQRKSRHDAGYVAPGNIALFLFPYHDHTPTGWQERQSVIMRCTGVDRVAEQLIFSPIHPD
ncbi:hypothetical protein BGZ99_007163 [Dissophora globulifera]|uniref:F-box domain-containing protein n=1 Tax=Dissophora globulifera TaxID=979702 RepID=A0A9P6REK9_9FUNG|nr:hypothetical protein BGZ99_007163 [Dissophora globulifera]